jgi:hypothetical protein
VEDPAIQTNTNPILRLFSKIIDWVFVLGIALILGGIAVAVIGQNGSSTINILGQKIQTTSTGVVGLFLGAVLILFNIRKISNILSKELARQHTAHPAAEQEKHVPPHPPTTEQRRTKLNPCSFRIHPEYYRKYLWEQNRDVLVEMTHPYGSGEIYLIPSDDAPPQMRIIRGLRRHPEWLREKREATEAFINRCGDARIDGYWFVEPKPDGARPVKVYAPAYDAALTAAFAEKHQNK